MFSFYQFSSYISFYGFRYASETFAYWIRNRKKRAKIQLQQVA